MLSNWKLFIILDGHGSNFTIRKIININENLIASSSDDKTIKIWDWNQGTCLKSIESHEGHVYAIELLNYKTIISGGLDKKICLWQ